jgi:hypothetical protein
VAVARKICVAVWHVLEGHAFGALKRLDTLQTKLGKFATDLDYEIKPCLSGKTSIS